MFDLLAVLNHEKLVKHLVRWISETLKSTGRRCLIFEEGDVKSEILQEICSLTNLPVIKIYANSQSNYNEYSELAWTAKYNNGIIVSDIDLCDSFSFNYHKHKPADIFPFADLLRSEILEIGEKYLNIKEPNEQDRDKYIAEIDSKNSLLEWAYTENINTGILNYNFSPVENPNWFKYTLKQKAILCRLHARRSCSQHKKLRDNAPCCFIRGVAEGLVR